MGEIKVGMRVKTSFGNAALEGLNVSDADLKRRRNGVAAWVDGFIAGTGRKGVWVIQDEIQSTRQTSFRQMQAQEDPAVEEAKSRMRNRAPFFADELTPL